jgi:hypothetical protein
MHKRLLFVGMMLAFLFGTGRGDSGNSRITLRQMSSDTIQLSVTFSDPVFLPAADPSAGGDSTVHALLFCESVYLECSGDRIEADAIKVEKKTDGRARRVILCEDVALDEDGKTTAHLLRSRPPLIATIDLGVSGGKHLFLVRLNPFFESEDGYGFRWIERLSLRCSGRGIRVVPPDSLKTDRILPAFSPARISKSAISGTIPEGPALKIWVENEGLYIIPQTAIVQAGWNVSSIDPRNLRLVGSTGEVPIRVTGQEDGTFDFTDAVEFFGEPLWNKDKPGEKRIDVYSEKNVYWLTAGNQPGLRIAEMPVWTSADEQNTSYPRSFPFTQHEEKDNSFSRFPEASPDQMDDAEYWTYTVRPVGGQSIDLAFRLADPDLYSTRPVHFRIKFRGQSKGSSGVAGQPIDVLLNNRLVLSDAWTENGVYILENREFSPAFLFDDSNKLTVVNRSQEGELSRVYIDWFEISFPRVFKAVNDYIRFRAPEQFSGQSCPFKIEGFGQPDVDIYKIGYGRLVGQHASSITDSLGKTTYTVTFRDQITDESTEYVALTLTSKIVPDSIAFVPRMALRERGRGADYIAIVPSDSLGAGTLRPLMELRQKQNLKTEIVLLDSIFNEFNFGIASPKAIRSFLAYAKLKWNPAPRFVLFVGDGNFNYRAVSGRGNTIPLTFYQTSKFGGAESDFWYTLLDGDNFPDVAIGRLPVRTRDELETAVGKIIQYENSAADPWKNKYLMIGAGTRAQEFGRQTNTLIQELVPHSLHADRMFLVGDPSDPEIGSTKMLDEYFNQGVGWINYRGHGGGAIWADEGLMDLDDAHELKNNGKYPFITSLTCFTGDFSGNQLSLGQALMKQKDGGAIAFMGSSSVGWVTTDYYLIQNVIKAYTSEPSLSIGEIIQNAKVLFAVENTNDIMLSELHQYNLLGDPALKLTFPAEATAAGLDKRSYSGVDSLRIHGENGQGNERILFEIVDSQNRVYGSREMDLPASAWDAALSLPPGFREKKAGLRTYSWNGTTGTQVRGYAPFAVETSYFDSVMSRPEHPSSRDSIRFQARIEDREAVRSVICDVFEPVRISLPMSQDPHTASGLFSSTAAIGPFAPGTHVLFQIIVESAAGVTRTDSVSFAIYTLPDLSVNSLFLGGTDRVMVQTRIQNSGQESAEKVRVRFEAPGSGLMAEDTVSVPAGGEVVAEVPVDVKEGNQLFQVAVNPDSSLLEGNYANNRYSRDLMFNAFNVTPENGSCLGAAGPDTVGIAARGRVPYAFCWIPPGSVTDRKVLLIRTDIRIDETAPDHEAESQTIHLFSFNGFPGEVEMSKDITMIFTVRSLQDADGVKPYQWIPSLRHWVSIPFTVRDTVFTATTRSIGLFSLMRNTDDRPPAIDIQMENQVFSDGCYVPERPVFSIQLQDPSGLDFRPDKIQIFLDDVPQPAGTYAVPDSVQNPAQVVVSFRPELSKGPHSLSVRSSDVHGNTAQTETFRFQVSDRFDVQFLGNHPNPFKRETVFAYVLTENADRFSIKLYTVAGKRIRVFEDGDLTSADYHEVEWNGKDEWGDEVANGVYFYRLTAVKGGDRMEITGKIARVR